MKGKKDFRQRVRCGEISGKDVRRLLAELACGKVNDCVKLALEENVCLDKLDLRLLAGVKKNDKGLVEILLIDRLKILEQLARDLALGSPTAGLFDDDWDHKYTQGLPVGQY